jgi:hypothetical protein
MSWTNENESKPQGDWGQGAVNDIGWGQAAQNLISWGMAHALSWGHAITNLVGSLGIPTEGLLWSDWLTDYTPESVNSGVGLNFVGVNGDFLEYPVISLVGDFKISFTANAGNFIKLAGGSNSFIETRSTNQFALNIPTRKVMTVMDSAGDVISLGREGSDLYAELNGVEVDRLIGEANLQTCNFQFLGRDFAGAFFNSDIFMFKFEGGGLPEPITFNLLESTGSITYSKEYATTGISGTINGATWLTGRPEGEQLYNWGVNKYTTGGVLDNDNGTVYITGEFQDSITDIKGAAIALPYIENVDNAPIHANHYSQLEAVAGTIDTSADLSVHAWLSVTTYGDGGQVLTNGSLSITLDAVNVTLTRDGITNATYAHNSVGFIFVGFTSGSGLTDIWIGDVDNVPIKVATGIACGTSTAATLPMYKNNNQALSNRLNGYNGIAAMQELITTDEDIQAIYNYTKGVISASTGFPLTFPITL